MNMTTVGPGGQEPSLLEAAWKHRIIVLVSIIVFGLLGFLVATMRGDSHTADAAVVIDVPVGVSATSGDVSAGAERQITNQLEVMRSRLVAERASELVADDGFDVTAREIELGSIITAVPESDVLEVSFSAEDPEIAVAVTGALIDGYREVRREQRAREVETILAQLDATETVLERQLSAVSERLAVELSGRALEGRIGSILDELAAVESQLSETTDPESREVLVARIDQLDRQMRTLQFASGIELEQPGVSNLVAESEDIEVRLAAVRQLRIQVEADAAAEGTGIAFLSSPAVSRSGGPLQTLALIAVALLLGVVIGVAIAYLLATSRRSFERPEEPEAILGVPYLADIPDFEAVGSGDALPVTSDPRSPAAEAFRFVASSLSFRAGRVDAKIIVVVSGSVGDGKSTISANTALAAARSGKRVLLVDADFGNQAASQLLLGDVSLGPGLSELVTGKANLRDAVRSVSAGPDATIDVMGRGTAPIVAPDLFAKDNTRVAVRRLADYYDLIILDPPPLLQVAYASNIVQAADAAVVVVSHNGSVRSTEALRTRLGLMETNVLGYVYNRARVRADMLETGGSMKDVLGDAGIVESVRARSDR